jgi:uncharacterized membrane protein YccC
VDTLLGSAISFMATWAVPPHWEANQLPLLAKKAFESARHYLQAAASAGIHASDPQAYRLARKHAYVDLANLTDAFDRMTNEPKHLQQHAPEWQQLVATSHVLLAHIAALRAETNASGENDWPVEAKQLLKKADEWLLAAAACLENPAEKALTTPVKQEFKATTHTDIEQLFTTRRAELAEGKMETATKNKLITLKTLMDPLEKAAHLSEELYKLCWRTRGQQPMVLV